MSSKLEEGDYKGAVRLACSRDTVVEHSTSNVEAMKMKHPSRQVNSTFEAQPQPISLSFTIDANAVRRAIMSFPNGSSGGADGLLPQHWACSRGWCPECLECLKCLDQHDPIEGKTPAPI